MRRAMMVLGMCAVASFHTGVMAGNNGKYGMSPAKEVSKIKVPKSPKGFFSGETIVRRRTVVQASLTGGSSHKDPIRA